MIFPSHFQGRLTMEKSSTQEYRLDKKTHGPQFLIFMSIFIMLGGLIIIIFTIYLYIIEEGIFSQYLLIWLPAVLMVFGGYHMYIIANKSSSRGYLLISSKNISYCEEDKIINQILFDTSVKADVHYNNIYSANEHGPLFGFSFKKGPSFIKFSGQNGYSVEDVRQIKPFIHAIVQSNNIQMSDTMKEYWTKYPPTQDIHP